MPDGLLNMLKPPGITSHDLVDHVRRTLHMRRVGHTGTLDPAAAGVVMVMLGSVTRLSQYLTSVNKVYRAEITLGIATDTLDGEGRVVQRESAAGITRERVAEELAALTGDLRIAPPLYSAVRVRGKRLYEIAREGGDATPEPRLMTVLRFDLLDFDEGETARVLTEIDCAKGTYVRSLAALLGERLRCGAYLSFLVRTSVGSHFIAQSLTPDELSEAARTDTLSRVLIHPADALAEFKRLQATREDAATLAHGNPVPARESVSEGEFVSVLTPDGRLLGVAEVIIIDGACAFQPRCILIPSDEL